MQLTRRETVTLELGRHPGFFMWLNEEFPEEEGIEFDDIDIEYQALEDVVEDALHNSEEVFGIDENGENKPLVLFPDRKPPVTRPTFPF